MRDPQESLTTAVYEYFINIHIHPYSRTQPSPPLFIFAIPRIFTAPRTVMKRLTPKKLAHNFSLVFIRPKIDKIGQAIETEWPLTGF